MQGEERPQSSPIAVISKTADCGEDAREGSLKCICPTKSQKRHRFLLCCISAETYECPVHARNDTKAIKYIDNTKTNVDETASADESFITADCCETDNIHVFLNIDDSQSKEDIRDKTSNHDTTSIKSEINSELSFKMLWSEALTNIYGVEKDDFSSLEATTSKAADEYTLVHSENNEINVTVLDHQDILANKDAIEPDLDFDSGVNKGEDTARIGQKSGARERFEEHNSSAVTREIKESLEQSTKDKTETISLQTLRSSSSEVLTEDIQPKETKTNETQQKESELTENQDGPYALEIDAGTAISGHSQVLKEESAENVQYKLSTKQEFHTSSSEEGETVTDSYSDIHVLVRICSSDSGSMCDNEDHNIDIIDSFASNTTLKQNHIKRTTSYMNEHTKEHSEMKEVDNREESDNICDTFNIQTNETINDTDKASLPCVKNEKETEDIAAAELREMSFSETKQFSNIRRNVSYTICTSEKDTSNKLRRNVSYTICTSASSQLDQASADDKTYKPRSEKDTAATDRLVEENKPNAEQVFIGSAEKDTAMEKDKAQIIAVTKEDATGPVKNTRINKYIANLTVPVPFHAVHCLDTCRIKNFKADPTDANLLFVQLEVDYMNDTDETTHDDIRKSDDENDSYLNSYKKKVAREVDEELKLEYEDDGNEARSKAITKIPRKLSQYDSDKRGKKSASRKSAQSSPNSFRSEEERDFKDAQEGHNFTVQSSPSGSCKMKRKTKRKPRWN